MQVPVHFKCICGKEMETWFDFANKNFQQTQVFYAECADHHNRPAALSKRFVVILKDMSFKAHSIIGLPENPDGDPV